MKKKKVHCLQWLSGHLPSKLKDESVFAYIHANKCSTVLSNIYDVLLWKVSCCMNVFHM